MSQEHPILCLFGASAAATFPLILIIGREPNADKPVTNFIGMYDFRWAPRCAFWNISYSVAARIVGTDTWTLKQRCIRQGGSPIVYADALPQGILNHVGGKPRHRATIAADDILRHIDNLFSHKPILDRVSLVIASGLGGSTFAVARQGIEQKCHERNLPLAHVAFFYPTNTGKILDQLSAAQKAIIGQAFAQFSSDKVDP
jgi:hypothetical protein